MLGSRATGVHPASASPRPKGEAPGSSAVVPEHQLDCQAGQLLHGNVLINRLVYILCTPSQRNWIIQQSADPKGFPLPAPHKCFSLLFLFFQCQDSWYVCEQGSGAERWSVTVVYHHARRAGHIVARCAPRVFEKEWIIRPLSSSLSCRRIESGFPAVSMITSLKLELVQWPT